jgi:hypothetical protein
MRRLLYLLTAILLLGQLEAASACSMANPPTDAQLFEKAAAVFVARVYRTEEIELPGIGGAPPTRGVEGAFRLEERLKGEPPANGTFKAPLVLMCGTPLLAGFDYAVFLDRDGFMIQALDKGTQLLLELSPGIEDKLCVSKACRVPKLRALAGKGP